MKRLLVLGAGNLQIPIIKKARQMGIFVIAVDSDSNAYGLKLANKGLIDDITSETKMLDIAREENINGVIHPCSEVAMTVMGMIIEELGLSGINYKIARNATNKYLMRDEFNSGNAPNPLYYCTNNVNDAWTIFNNHFNTSVILKPSRNSGSRGIVKIEKQIAKSDFFELYARSLNESKDNQVLLEQFIDGPEFSVEIIVVDFEPHVIAVTDKKTTGAPHFIELGHSQPSIYPNEIIEKIKDASILGVKSLNLNNCAAHAEIKIQDDMPYLMEIGARLGGDFISTDLVFLSTGIDMVAAAINLSLGLKPNLLPCQTTQSVAIRYFVPNPGKIISINLPNIINKNIYSLEIYKNVGEIIPELRSSKDRSGHVIVTSKTPQTAIQLAESIIQSVEFKLEKQP